MAVLVAFAAGISYSQPPAGAAANPATPITLAAFKDQANAQTVQWNQLAGTLEQRMARMLPCDERIKSSIDEVSRVSQARLTATMNYWRAVSAQSKNDNTALALLIAEQQARAANWSLDREDAAQERSSVDAHAGALRASAARLPSLSEAVAQMDSLSAATQAMLQRATQREADAAAFIEELQRVLQTNQAAQAAIDRRADALNAENARWSEYYAARAARAVTECTITNPDAARRLATPRPGVVPGKPPAGKGAN